MFSKSITKEVVFDNEGTPVKVVIRKLSARSLAAAAQARATEFAKQSSALGTDMIRMFRETAVPADVTPVVKDPKVARAAKLDGYDRDYVLTAGIASWDAPVPLVEGIGDLDEASAARLFREILDLTIPEDEIPNG